MTDKKPPRARMTAGVAAAVVAVVLGACGLGGQDEPLPAPPRAGLVIAQNGLPGLELNRQVLEVSTTDLETVLGNNNFLLAGQTEHCGLATNESLGVAAVTDDDLAVVAFVVERDDAATREGIRLGSSTDDIIETYGKGAVFARDVPSRTGGQIVWVTDLGSPGAEPTNSSLHYAFDTDATGAVTRIRAGFWPHVADADYCSDSAGRPEATGWPLT